ncbi:hypothetical protein F5146DRAFT_1140871 [Armillaria mellea]|nr:hypothetical protein F5146DRAFT_1140871 [Armillaria mellea]
MFPCSISTLLILGISIYEASMPSTDVSRRWEAPVPVVGFDYGAPAIINEDVDACVCQATPGAINGLLEPIVFATAIPDSSTRLLDDLEITVDDPASQGIIRQLLEPAIVETVSAVTGVLAPAATMSVEDAPKVASVPRQRMQVSLRVARAQSNLRTFKSLAISVFMVVVVALLVMVFKQAFRSFYPLFFKSIPIPAPRPWHSSLLGSTGQVSLFTLIIMVLISFALGFLARSVSFEKFSAVLDKLCPLFVDLCSCFGAMTSWVIESAVFTMFTMVDVRLGSEIRQGEVVMENILVSEEGEHLETSVGIASLLSGDVCSDVVQPLKTSISIQSIPEVHQVKNVSVGTDQVSRTSIGVQCQLVPEESKDISIGTDPTSMTSLGVQVDLAPEEPKDVFTPGDSLYAMTEAGNSRSQTMAAPDIFSVPRVTSVCNLYTMAPTISFPSVESVADTTEFERLRKEILVFGETDHENSASLSASTLGTPCPSPLASTSTPPLRRRDGFEYFDPDFGPDARHLWAREFWHVLLRRETLIKDIYDVLLPVEWDEDTTDEDKSKMEMGLHLVRSYARRLSEHAVNPILRLPGNILPEEEEEDDYESSALLEEDQPTIETSVSSTASVDIRSPSPFVRPSNPQSRLLDSSEASVAAPSIWQRIPSPPRRRPALAQMTNAPRTVRPSPSRTPIKVRGIQGAEQCMPTPPPSSGPKLAKRASRFPLAAPTTRRKDESGSSTCPAKGIPSSSKFPRWRG